MLALVAENNQFVVVLTEKSVNNGGSTGAAGCRGKDKNRHARKGHHYA